MSNDWISLTVFVKSSILDVWSSMVWLSSEFVSDYPVYFLSNVFYFLYHNFDILLSCSTFSIGIKYAKVTLIHEKDDKTDKEKYGPINILPNLNKVYERLMYTQIYPYFHTTFSKFQCGFGKGFNA